VSIDLPANELPSQDDRIMAALAHVSILLPFTGLLASIIIWATQKSKSAYVRFQALQAIVYHLIMIVAWFVAGGCYFCSSFGVFPILLLAEPRGTTDPAAAGPAAGLALLAFFLPLAVFLLGIVFGIAYILFGLVAAALTLQGKPFRYPLLGRRIERYLQTTAPAPPAAS